MTDSYVVLFLGADPGATHGSIAAIDSESNVVDIHAMPNFELAITRTRKNKKTGKSEKKPGIRHDTDSGGVARIVRKITAKAKKVFACIEAVGNLPPAFGTIANATLQKNLGVLEGVCHGLCQKVFMIPAKTWQKEMFENKVGKADKQKSIKLACELWPSHAEEITLDDSGGKAEALLIAESIRRKYIRRK